MNKNRYLLDYRKDIASQFGEDGIIEKIFDIIKPTNKWCVEFGAWDGEHLSNTFNLIQNSDWNGVLIEGNKKKCAEIMETHKGKQVFPINSFVGWSGENSLDNLLSKTNIPHNFDFLSIDIDSNDYHVWKALKNYRPKVVVIEYNATIPSNIEFVQEANPDIIHGTSILSMTKMAKEKGYECVCINQENIFYVDKKFFPLFEIEDNSIEALKHFREPLQVYQLYDGTMVFHGAQYIYYHGIAVDMNRLYQPLPHYLRKKNLMWRSDWLENPVKKLYFTFLLRLLRRIYRPRIKSTESAFDWKQKYE